MKYPRIGTVQPHQPRGRCKLCGEIGADMRVDIQLDILRGNDEVMHIHKECFIVKDIIALIHNTESGGGNGRQNE